MPPLAPGTKLGRYEIRSQLGAGGMGEVFLAVDTDLDRTVALKILPAKLASDTQRMRRFVQEAKAASGLNHQNIITIYEIGETDSTRYIATEFVDGLTLRQRMKQAPLTLNEVLDISIQVGSALAAAHEAGIIHRDIKPENIMLRSRDSFVKVLDFGLVKLTESAPSITDTEAPTRALVNTDAGTVLGTVFYMSPEQARGKAVDARTDIWSFGVILYEMVTGQVPFGGETSADVIASIVKSEPPPLSRYAPAGPEKLADIIAKTLEKDRDERYQTIKDLLVDLRRLKKRLDFEAEMERSVPPYTVSQEAVNTVTRASQSRSQTLSLEATRPTTSAEYIVSEIKQHKTGVIIAVLAVVLTLGAAAFIWSRLPTPAGTNPAPTMKITRLTSGGRVNNALIDGSTSISPNGKYVVFTLMEADGVSLWVRQISTGSDVLIVPPTPGRNAGTTISRDGEFVYYVGIDKENPLGTLYKVPILGGTPRRVLSHISSPIGFSPDGERFAFVREAAGEGSSILTVANTDGTGERALAVRKGNDWFGGSGPSWAPDGKTIACAAGTDTGGSHMTVVGVSVDDGATRPLTSQKWLGDVFRVLWLSDGSGLVVSAQSAPQRISPSQLWFISSPEGTARRITNDLNGYGAVSLGVSDDNSTIVTVQSDPSIQIWTTALNEPASGAKQISYGKNDGATGLDWMPDGRIVFVRQTGGSPHIWIMNGDGTETRQLTAGEAADGDVDVSPDGKYIFFTSSRSGLPQTWRMNPDGTDLKQITSGNFADLGPVCSPDGKWVVFESWRSGKPCLWKVSADGGEPVQLTQKPATRAAFSPDGKLIATGYFVEGEAPPWKIAIIPAEGGEPIKLLEPSEDADLWTGFWWTPDSRALIYKADRATVGNLYSQPLDGGKAQQITSFESELIYKFSISLGGKRIALSRGHSSLDVVLIKDFR